MRGRLDLKLSFKTNTAIMSLKNTETANVSQQN